MIIVDQSRIRNSVCKTVFFFQTFCAQGTPTGKTKSQGKPVFMFMQKATSSSQSEAEEFPECRWGKKTSINQGVLMCNTLIISTIQILSKWHKHFSKDFWILDFFLKSGNECVQRTVIINSKFIHNFLCSWFFFYFIFKILSGLPCFY